ncbi:MAG: DUF1585 domain-containing protein [Acidobacteria bacterium]|nr:DUF1585 domain-containing protein [Acidobacteriota bacterium]
MNFQEDNRQQRSDPWPWIILTILLVLIFGGVAGLLMRGQGETDGGAKIDTADTLFDGTKVDGPVNLRQAVLGRSDQFARTMTEMLLTYGVGRKIEYYDMPVVRSILKDAARNNYRFSSLVLGIVKSGPFQMKVKQTQDSGN